MNINILFLLILLTLLLCGCSVFYDLTRFAIPEDNEFLEDIALLNTPEKICWYMERYFEYEPHDFYTPSPYDLWKSGKGDCNDYSTFATFVADCHGIESYQIFIKYKDTTVSHAIGVFLVDGKFNFSDCWVYMPIKAGSFREIVNYNNVQYSGIPGRAIKSYQVFDSKMNVVEEGQI